MSAVDGASFMQALINAAEKASNIARTCRANEQLLTLLVQEKSGEEANKRFEHDFKTLADVLIQETIKHDVGALFPDIREAIKGEESPTFTNQMGECVAISVGETEADTVVCLTSVLEGYSGAAEALAAEVHRDVVYDAEQLGNLPELPDDFDYGNYGIWIDPIDATAEYITGDSIFTDFPGITSTGLDCVTVLIGVYDRQSGTPIIGVISQPFHKKVAENIYESLIFWGVALPELQAHNFEALTLGKQRSNRLGIFSSSENADILQHVLDLGYELTFSAGAGHKALKVITGEVDLYLLSKSSTFKWDTCAPQAILRALGGDIFDFRESITNGKPISLTYTEQNAEEDNEWKCNKGGLIAVRDLTVVEPLLEKLSGL